MRVSDLLGVLPVRWIRRLERSLAAASVLIDCAFAGQLCWAARLEASTLPRAGTLFGRLRAGNPFATSCPMMGPRVPEHMQVHMNIRICIPCEFRTVPRASSDDQQPRAETLTRFVLPQTLRNAA